ncbi:nicotinate phosphoribosyltransferase [Candidatus Bathyarchaeota archaeon]|nr:MAG: nicotinate phosphoribosyltransferase [Candidatus Bathyarchaeota archaeon]
MRTNIVTMTDSYKMTHHRMYPEGTEVVYSYFEARKGAVYNNTVFFGLQYLIKEYLTGRVVYKEAIDKAEILAAKHFGNPDIFDRERWDYILDVHDGHLPVRIKAVPEGTVVPIDNVLLTIENTDPKCFWLTNHLETMLSWLWYPSTVATLSYSVKETVKKYLEETADSIEGLPFKLHDFGYRGATCNEAARMGGAAHLLNFLGTDTVGGMELAMDYYDADLDSLAFSIPATEHSVMTSLGEDGELEVYKNLLKEYPTGLLAIVSDSYDIYRAVDKYIGTELREQVINREGTLVIRPDSGNPIATILRLLEILEDRFGCETNSKGYKVLPPYIRLIWGDGIDPKGIEGILKRMKFCGWSADNVAYGMGGGLLQKVNRDTQRFAFKCSAVKRNGEWFTVQKRPLDKTKVSKKGWLALVPSGKGFTTLQDCQRLMEADVLQTVFLNGKLCRECSFEDVRRNVSCFSSLHSSKVAKSE